MFGFFGVKSTPQKDSSSHDEPRALPASWYRSAAMYELERRAIFSRKWILLTHKLRFKKAGDYVSFTEAGFSFFLVMDRDGQINAFHNVCRHRAFPIVTQGCGNAAILSCKYHGWSYGFKGNLAKAPRFETVPDFDKTKHNLLPVNLRIDAKGFIWINLEAGKPSIAWEEDFDGVDTQERLAPYDLMNDYHYDHTWTMEGDYNWKTLADNYNECYHCPTGHPGVNAVSNLAAYRVETKGGHIQHFNQNKDETDTTMQVASSFLFPNACFTVTPDFFYMMRCIPMSAGKTLMEYDVFRHNNTDDDNFKRINEFFNQVLQEDKDLCNGTQKNLEGGIFINGQLHPEKEKGPIFFQETIRQVVMEHRAREEEAGHDIWPASPPPTAAMKTGKFEEEEAFCAKLDMGACDGASEQLSW
ncbi:Choline monooxygenase, chloroplastic [Fusarium sp. Ph1]|nr:Choline monooxygenase, chloroplastic [Fusarium sp. Ph1]